MCSYTSSDTSTGFESSVDDTGSYSSTQTSSSELVWDESALTNSCPSDSGIKTTSGRSPLPQHKQPPPPPPPPHVATASTSGEGGSTSTENWSTTCTNYDDVESWDGGLTCHRSADTLTSKYGGEASSKYSESTLSDSSLTSQDSISPKATTDCKEPNGRDTLKDSCAQQPPKPDDEDEPEVTRL